jgi:glycerol-3-phosphate O-acyltransferase / dihydroxyacetone phosphate acyltransferase
MGRVSDGVMRRLARFLIRIFFRRVEVEGLGRLPVAGPTVVVANHINGLVDALLLMATLPRFPRFLGKSTLFRIPLLWPFLKLAGVIPVYRTQDGEPTERNVSSFRTCRRLLAEKAQVALFPEGVSHDESVLQPLKTGAARIALGAAFDDGVTGVVVIPVGLSYDAKARFRSRALVRVGAGEDVGAWEEGYRIDPHRAVRDLTAETAQRLSDVSPTYRSWVQADELRQIAAIVVRPPAGAPGDVDLARSEETARALAEIEKSGAREVELEALRVAWADYARDLALLGLSDAQLADRDRPGHRRLVVTWALMRVVAALPAAAAGAVIHIIPYRIMKRLGAVPTNESIKATVKLLGCFVLFTLVYAAIGVTVGENWGAWAGLAAAVGAPVCGYAAVRLGERVKRIGGVVAGSRVLRQRRAVLTTVRAHRQVAVDAAASVLTGPPGP